MTDDPFFERLREDATQLRYEPADDAFWARLEARIQQRVRTQPTVAQMLAGWFRPIAVSLATLSLIAALSVQWIERTHEPATMEAMVSASAPGTDIGDAIGVE